MLVPVHPFKVGVTVIVPVIFAAVPLAGAIQGLIFPIPLAGSPMAVFEFIHVKLEPEGALPKFGKEMVAPGQTATFDI